MTLRPEQGLQVSIRVSIPWRETGDWGHHLLAFVEEMRAMGIDVQVEGPTPAEVDVMLDELRQRLQVADAPESEKADVAERIREAERVNRFRWRWAS